ncbi:OLC1v1015547C1 [Oldenlandia corymbosa var. corymbosa]|uniref:OLC1v1015547C1 n=1 Tax=Oldenlandia corymbosa var. corymbosa TaxID=529605 RepID=A0AAV1E4D0_OLDCO|nr:OLC1v1015547C1 [Oldenlandia corymbosa var. corymbosa]
MKMSMLGLGGEMSLSSLLLPLFLSLITFFLLQYWLKHCRKNLPPSPPKLPIIGNLHQLGFLPHRSLKSLAESHGPLMLLHFGSKPTLIISSPEVAEMFFKTNELNFLSRPKANFVGRLVYNFRDLGFAPYGEYWKQARSICVLQLLSNKRVQSFRSVREDEISLMLDDINESCLSHTPMNMSEMLSTLTLNLISRVAIGKRYSEEKRGTKVQKMLEEFMELLATFNVGDYIPWLGWINHINGLEAKVNRVAKELDAYFENIVEEGMRKREKVVNGEEKIMQQNFVDVLLDLQEKDATTRFALQRASLKAIILDMYAAGTDTVSTLLEWVMSELVRNKNVMTKLKDEVRGLSNGNLNWISEDDLEKLPYLRAVIKETCRMHPPAPMLLPRESKDNINVMGYDIPAGTQVFINVFAIGRSSSLWKNVDEFQPERFLNTSIDLKGKNFELLPFGYGRRSCPGMAFTLATVEVALANLILKFNFALPYGTKVEDLDMSEVPSSVVRRKTPLILEATPVC